MLRILVILCLSAMISCQDEIKEPIILEIDILKKSSYSLSSLLDTTRIIKLDSKAILGSIEKIVYSKGIFLVGDFNNTKSINLFDKEGFLISEIKCKEKITDFVVGNNGNLYILAGQYLIAYDTRQDKEYLYKLRVPFYATSLTVLEGNLFCFNLHKSQSYDMFKSEFIITDQDLELVSNYIPYTKNCEDGFHALKQPFGNDYKNSSIVRKFDPSIYNIENDELVKIIGFDFGINSSPVQLESYCHDKFLSLINDHDDSNEKILGIDNFYQYSNSVYATYSYQNYVHAIHYDLQNQKYFTYSLGDIENDLFEGDFYFTPQAKYSDNEFIFINEPLYNDKGLPVNPSLVIARFKTKI